MPPSTKGCGCLATAAYFGSKPQSRHPTKRPALGRNPVNILLRSARLVSQRLQANWYLRLLNPECVMIEAKSFPDTEFGLVFEAGLGERQEHERFVEAWSIPTNFRNEGLHMWLV